VNVSETEKTSAAPATRQPASRDLAVRLWTGYLSRYWPLLALSLLAMVIYAGSVALIPVGLEWVVAGFTGATDRFAPRALDVALWGPVIVIALGAVNAVAQYWQARLSANAALSTLRDLQADMFNKLLALDFAQQREEVSGQIISRFTNDMTVLREALSRVSKGVKSVFEMAGLCAVIVWYDWRLALIFLGIYALIGIPVARIGKVLRRTSASAQAQAGDLTSLIGESVSGARMVKSFQIEPLERARAGAAFDERLTLFKKMAYARALNEPFIFFAGAVAIAIVISIVALRISSGAIGMPEFAAFVAALLLMSQPARALGTLNAVVQEGFGAFERMTSLLDAAPTITNAPGAIALVAGPGAISFERVSFGYNATARALDGVSLDIPAGAMVALVGASGAGKSTMLNLIPRLYDPDKGRIIIDGQDIGQASIHSLRAHIAFVSQDAVLFNMSALENIAFGRPGASRAEIIKAASDAAANDFIALAPQGYDTPLGEGGANLSGGQRQRIALARAFLKDAPILLLDEATSALDAESETKIQEALKRLTKGRTTLVIAHRLSTVKDADLIAVMDKGRIVETGKHDDLLAKGGAYAKQAKLQLS